MTGLCVVGALLALVVKGQSGDGAAAGGGGRRGGGPGPGGRGEGAAGLPGGAGVGQRRVRGPVCPCTRPSASPWWCRWEATSAGTRESALASVVETAGTLCALLAAALLRRCWTCCWS
ncbi:MAG: hypothetical protein ACLTYN_13240 [Dysosmobacter welbionis]